MVFVRTNNWQSPLCGSVLPQDTAGTTLKDPELTANMIDASTATRGAQKFPFAEADSDHQAQHLDWLDA